MAVLNRSQLIQKRDLARESVAVPELGGEVLVRELTAKERDEFDVSSIKRNGKKIEQNLANLRARLCVKAVIDEQGEPLLTEADAAALGDQPGSIIDRIYAVAARLSGITKDDEKELAEKNVGSDPNSGLPTVSL